MKEKSGMELWLRQRIFCNGYQEKRPFSKTFEVMIWS